MFTEEDNFYTYNEHSRPEENTLIIALHKHYRDDAFAVNIFTNILGKWNIESFLLSKHMASAEYRTFPEQVFLALQKSVALSVNGILMPAYTLTAWYYTC